MVPPQLKDFLVATTGASSAFIGLLFVALTLVLERKEEDKSRYSRDRLLAESSYAGLVNVFFVSILGLVPGNRLGHVLVVMALLGLVNVVRTLRLSRRRGGRILLVLSAAVFLWEAVYGAYLVHDVRAVASQSFLITLILTLFGFSLARAWELTGIRRG
jgi:hypothetical protein